MMISADRHRTCLRAQRPCIPCVQRRQEYWRRRKEALESEEWKVLLVGHSGVGKTCVVVRYVGNLYNKHVSPTIGASFFTCKMTLDSYRIKLQVWDTAGQERFRSMAPMYYRRSNAAMLCYDITSRETFEDMQSWVQELKKNVDGRMVLCVLGNKIDLKESRQVSVEEAEEYAASIGAEHYETSALSNQGIQDAFCHVARQLITMYEDCPDSGLRRMDPDPGERHSANKGPPEPRGGCCS